MITSLEISLGGAGRGDEEIIVFIQKLSKAGFPEDFATFTPETSPLLFILKNISEESEPSLGILGGILNFGSISTTC